MSCPACVVFITLKKKTGNGVAGARNDDEKYKKRLFCVNLFVDEMLHNNKILYYCIIDII